MKMIVGLGNPGREYANTRHNVGFMVIDELVTRHGTGETSNRMGAWTGRSRIGSTNVMLVKPQTFMNLSGEAVGRIWRWNKMALDDVLIISDDIDMPFGRLRLRARGSAGGHNGLRSLFSHFGSQEVARLKIGVGRPDHAAARDYVLAPFQESEKDELRFLLQSAADAVELYLRVGINPAMNRVNVEASPSGGAETSANGRSEA